MELPPGLWLNFEAGRGREERDFIDNSLPEYYAPFLRKPSYTYLGIFARSEAGVIRAGLTAKGVQSANPYFRNLEKEHRAVPLARA